MPSIHERLPGTPEVAFEVRRSPRLVIGIATWTLGLAYGLCAADAIALGWRALLTLLAFLLIAPSWARVLCGWGPSAVRHIRWERDGTWTVTLAGGVIDRGCRLSRGSSAAGPFVWLVLQGRTSHHAVLDRRVQGAAGFAALRRRLQVQRSALR